MTFLFTMIHRIVLIDSRFFFVSRSNTVSDTTSATGTFDFQSVSISQLNRSSRNSIFTTSDLLFGCVLRNAFELMSGLIWAVAAKAFLFVCLMAYSFCGPASSFPLHQKEEENQQAAQR